MRLNKNLNKMGILSKIFGSTEPTNDEKFESLTGSIENIFRVLKVSVGKIDSEYYIINNYAGDLPRQFSEFRVKVSNKMPEKLNHYDQFMTGCKESIIAKINVVRNKSGNQTLYTQLENIINSI